MKSYKELEIYNLSYELAVKVHEMSLKLPKFEMFEEGSQIRDHQKELLLVLSKGMGERNIKLILLNS